MKYAKYLSVFFAVMAAVLIAATAVAYGCFHQTPPMIQTPVEEAEVRAEELMEAICRGDYALAAESLYGNPELQWNGESASDLGALIWPVYCGSMSYEFSGPCYATGAGIFRDVTVTVLDIPALKPKIQGRFLQLMDPYLADAQYDSEAFDENGVLRQELGESILRQAVELTLQEEHVFASYKITLELVYRNGQWWVVPSRSLTDIVAGVTPQ